MIDDAELYGRKIAPNNPEQLEALQLDVDALKAQQMRDMSEEDRARLELIEQCVQKLEGAKIPFVLFASVDPTGLTPYGSRSWWQYNAFAYPDEGEDPFEAKIRKGVKSAWIVIPIIQKTISYIFRNVTIGMYGPDDKLQALYRDGKQVYPALEDIENPKE